MDHARHGVQAEAELPCTRTKDFKGFRPDGSRPTSTVLITPEKALELSEANPRIMAPITMRNGRMGMLLSNQQILYADPRGNLMLLEGPEAEALARDLTQQMRVLAATHRAMSAFTGAQPGVAHDGAGDREVEKQRALDAQKARARTPRASVAQDDEE
jgi:hypothetical protein